MNRQQIAAWAGMLGPALFVILFTIEGWLRPGYNWLSTYVSELSLGSRGWIQIASFVVFGALFLVFTQGVAAEFHDGRASRAGPILLTIIAIGFLASGPFVTDPMLTPATEMSLHGRIHGIFGAIVFSLSPISCFVFLRRFNEDPRWQSFRGWTLVAGVIVALAVVLLSIATKLPTTLETFRAWLGVIQRTIIIPYLIWLFTFAWNLLRRVKQA